VKQQARPRLGQPGVAIDALLCHPPQRQPEHAVVALLPDQLQASPPLNVHQPVASELAALEAGLKGLERGDKRAAVMAQGGGHSRVPTVEVVGVQNGGQPMGLRTLPRQWGWEG
jgi:hypothetical protein